MIREVERRVQSEFVETIRDLASITRIVMERTEAAGFDAQYSLQLSILSTGQRMMGLLTCLEGRAVVD